MCFEDFWIHSIIPGHAWKCQCFSSLCQYLPTGMSLTELEHYSWTERIHYFITTVGNKAISLLIVQVVIGERYNKSCYGICNVTEKVIKLYLSIYLKIKCILLSKTEWSCPNCWTRGFAWWWSWSRDSTESNRTGWCILFLASDWIKLH